MGINGNLEARAGSALADAGLDSKSVDAVCAASPCKLQGEFFDTAADLADVFRDDIPFLIAIAVAYCEKLARATDITGARNAVETLLREEIADIEQQIAADRQS